MKIYVINHFINGNCISETLSIGYSSEEDAIQEAERLYEESDYINNPYYKHAGGITGFFEIEEITIMKPTKKRK